MKKSRMIQALPALSLSLLWLLPGSVSATTPFEFDYRFERSQPVVIDLAGEDVDGLPMAPPSPVPAEVDQFFAYLNGMRSNPLVTNPPGCVPGSISDSADCYSLTDWLERTIRALLSYEVFQNRLQDMLDGLFDDPDTPYPDPLIDEQLSIPLIGTMNIGMFIQDLWNPASCGPPDTSSAAGPRLIVNTSRRIGCKYGDNDNRAVNLIGILQGGHYDVRIESRGAQDGNNPLPPGQTFEGGLMLHISLTQPLDVDMIFRQPDFPAVTDSGYYLHAAGKARLRGITLELEIFTVGGHLRGLSGPSPAGYSVGLDFRRLYIAGGVDLDIDTFLCQDLTSSDPRVYNNNPSCAVSDMVGHPDWGNQNQYRDNTNDQNQLVDEAVKYIEAAIVYEAERASGAVAQYLTALEVLDLQTMTHEITGGTIYNPYIENPLTGENIYFDYGVFWFFNGEYGTVAGSNNGANLVGGYGLELTYAGGADCTGAWNPIPGTPATRVPMQPTAPIYFRQTRASRDAFLGAGLHINPLNQAVDALWEQKVLCMSLWSGAPGGIGDAVGDILNTSTFRPFLPSLDRTFDDRDMMIRVVPRYVEPGASAASFNAAVDQPKVTFAPGDPLGLIDGTTFAEDPVRYPGPFDMRLELPHVELQFLVDVVGDGQYASFTEVFSADVRFDLYLGLGWYRVSSDLLSDPAGFFPGLPGDSTCRSSPWPCRVLRVNAFLDMTLNKITEYGGAGVVLNPAGLENAISSLIGMLLDGVLQGKLELMLNTASPDFLGIVLDPGVPSGGAPGIGDPAYFGTLVEPLDLAPNAAAGSTNGIYEYLGIFATIGDIYGGYNPDGSVNPVPDGKSDTLSPVMIYDLIEDSGVFDLVGAPAAAPRPQPDHNLQNAADPHPSPRTFWRMDTLELYGAELVLTSDQVLRLGLGEPGAVLTASGLAALDAPEDLVYQYRINNGFFRLSRGGDIPMPALLDGHHTVEVWAVDRRGYVDPTPAVANFTLDRVPPRIEFVGDTALAGRGGELRIGVEARDRIAASEDVHLEWRLNDGAWKPVVDGQIRSRVEAGQQRLEVRAVDPSGNESVRTLDFTGERGGFGCNAGGSETAPAWLLIMLALLAARGIRRNVKPGA